jgi:hypothetical protein
MVVCTRSLNWPCTRSAGIRDSSLADDSLQRRISFRLGQVTDQVVLHPCVQRSRRARAACRTARGIAMRMGPGGALAANMGCPGCRGPERTHAACRSAGAGARYEVARMQGAACRTAWVSSAHAGAGNRHALGSRRSTRCEHGLPRVQGSRENTRCLGHRVIGL